YHLTSNLQLYSDKSMPLFIAAQQETGSKGMTSIPSQQTLGTINNRLYTKQAADIVGKEMVATGINMNLGPDLSLSKDNATSFSEHITLVAQHGRATVEGYQKHGIISAATKFLDHYNVIPDQ